MRKYNNCSDPNEVVLEPTTFLRSTDFSSSSSSPSTTQGLTYACAWNYDCSLLATCGADATIRIFSMLDFPSYKMQGPPIKTGRGIATHVGWSPRSALISCTGLTHGLHGVVLVYDVKTHEKICECGGFNKPLAGGCVWQTYGHGLAACSRNEIRLFNANTGQQRGKTAVPPRSGTDQFLSIDLSNNGNLILAALSDHSVRVYETSSMLAVSYLTGSHKNWVNSVKFSPFDQNLCLSGGGDGQIFLWNLQTKERIGEAIQVHHRSVETVDFFTPDVCMSTGDDRCIHFVDLVSRREICPPLRHFPGLLCSSQTGEGGGAGGEVQQDQKQEGQQQTAPQQPIRKRSPSSALMTSYGTGGSELAMAKATPFRSSEGLARSVVENGRIIASCFADKVYIWRDPSRDLKFMRRRITLVLRYFTKKTSKIHLAFELWRVLQGVAVCLA